MAPNYAKPINRWLERMGFIPPYINIWAPVFGLQTKIFGTTFDRLCPNCMWLRSFHVFCKMFLNYLSEHITCITQILFNLAKPWYMFCLGWIKKKSSELIYIIRNWISTLEFGFALGSKEKTMSICFDVSIDRFWLEIF